VFAANKAVCKQDGTNPGTKTLTGAWAQGDGMMTEIFAQGDVLLEF